LDATPSQLRKPAAQAPSAQVPTAQVAAALAKEQRAPQPPQLFASVARTLVSHPLDATPSQLPKPVAQAPTAHAPATHACVETLVSAQAAPQPPQLLGSVAVATQLPLHAESPAPQVAVHAPAEQTWPAPHALPHAPQLALSVLTLRSQPSAAVTLQSRNPEPQVPSAQVPAAHVAAALAKAHRTPQPPQLFTSVARTLVSHPFAAIPSQLPKPAAHTPTAQAPATHACVETLVSAQAAPQPPQLLGSVAVATQLPPQVESPAPQVAVHMPAEQTWPAAHALPHAPQLRRSLERSRQNPPQFVVPD
jgi:hypothetical protein